jgi:hypothetical protein
LNFELNPNSPHVHSLQQLSHTPFSSCHAGETVVVQTATTNLLSKNIETYDNPDELIAIKGNDDFLFEELQPQYESEESQIKANSK